MTTEFLLGMFLLASTLVWTPGPNNTLLANSGARHGLVRTLPHSMGVNIGFAFMVFTICLGLGSVFVQFPLLREVLRWAGAAILLWLSWKIGTSKFEPPHEVKTSKPWGFFQAAAFQWVNPKAWIMAISFAGQLPDQEPFWYPPLVISLVILAAGMLSSHGWVLFGVGIQRFLSTPLRFRIFSFVMAGLLVLTVIGLLLADLSVH